MAISTMRKLSLIARKEDANRILRDLLWLSCVEVETTDLLEQEGSGTLLQRAEYGTEKAEIDRTVTAISNALSLLDEYQTKSRGLFPAKAECKRTDFEFSTAYRATMKMVREINQMGAKLSELKNKENHKKTVQASVLPWVSYDVPLEITHTRQTQILRGTFPEKANLEEISERIQETTPLFSMELVSADALVQYVTVIYHRDKETEMLQQLSQNGFLQIFFKEEKGTALEVFDQLEIELQAIASERLEVEQELRTQTVHRPALELAYDSTRTEQAEIMAKQKLACTTSTLVLTGWVPEKAEKKVTTLLDTYACCYEYSAPEEQDDVPVLLLNNKFSTPFQFVIGLYSLPAYKTFDPTFLVSIFYFIIFGLMLGDVGYGLILMVCGFVGAKLLKPKPSMKRFLHLFGICGISCILSGILFGSYFGDLPTAILQNMFGVESLPQLALWFNPLENPIGLLLISLGIGAIHLVTGMGVRFYILWTSGKPFDAIFDIGSWYVVFIGIGCLFFNGTVGAIVALTGVALLILTQGRQEKNIIMKLLKGLMSLYDIVSYISDLLSYSRILALGLAATVISSVVNILGTMGGATIGGFIGLIFAFVVGHTLNLALNVLGTFVHTSRLQYIEFFGKFYVDGGRPFQPIEPNTTYTIVE